MPEAPTTTALAYHLRTRHAPFAYARALAYMDWDTQPDPFRRYVGAPVVMLDRSDAPWPEGEPGYDAVLDGALPLSASLDWSSVSRLFLDSLALSAWKESGEMRWSLRVNPSSGNLHPTEAYLVAGPVPDLGDEPAVYHYNPFLHGLERRAVLPPGVWARIAADLPPGTVLVGLSSIPLRESWKYGERAFRYCQHDLGHAIGAVTIAAAALGWRARLLESVPDAALAELLGIATQRGPEAEIPECLLALSPGHLELPVAQWRHYRLPALPRLDWAGVPAPLASDHQAWPIIDVVAEATRNIAPYPSTLWEPAPDREGPGGSDAGGQLRGLVRQRRSAVSMDGKTPMRREDFLRTLRRVLPGAVPLRAFPWRPRVHLFVFVHRVTGLAPGLYAFVRDGSDLREVTAPTFGWEPVDADLPLFRLRAGDERGLAQSICCGQEIAGDGAFSLGMVTDLVGNVESMGAQFYRRLHWEAGAIGQVLYLEAEASGIRGTGIGCFFDDAMHVALGLAPGWRTIYHFTVGTPADDERLRTVAPYAHLGDPGR